MNVEKSYPSDTSPHPERNTRQGHPQHSQIRQRKDNVDNEAEEKGIKECSMEYRDGQAQERALYQPNLWWFTSTAFPLIAGTFGPIANLFSVCSLVETWRTENVHGGSVPDPPWITVLGAFSLLLAIIANWILLFNFAHRIRYALAQPLTISLWYFACVFLVIPIGLTRLPRFSPSTHPTFTYSQSFYYAVISASLYFTISTLLLLNVIGASRFIRAYPPTFAVLTYPQRTLMLQTMSFSLYLALGAGVFSRIEGWSFPDGVYWADYTVLTIGLGTDFPLKRTLSRMLLIPYAPFGITLIGLVAHSVMGLVLERAKEKVVTRHLGKERDRWMDTINKTLEGKEEAKGLQLIVPRPRSLVCCWHYKRDKKFQQLPRVIAHARSTQNQGLRAKWHHAEFELMRHIQITSEQSERYIALVASFLAFLLIWIGGSLVFWACEHKHQRWTYTEALYFTYTTLLTIGYGDFFPQSPGGKPFFVIWSLVAVPTMTVLIGNMGDTVVRTVQEVTDWMWRRTVSPEYKEKSANKEEGERGEVNDQASSQSDRIEEPPSMSYPALVSPAPSFSPGRTLPMRNYADIPLGSSSMEGQKIPRLSQAGTSSEPVNEENPVAGDTYARQQSPQNNGEQSDHSPTTVQAEAAFLAREISKLAKDVGQQPPKKYGWEEWVNWLKMLGEEGVAGRKAMELDKEVFIGLPNTAGNRDTQVEHPHHDDSEHHHKFKHHRRHHSHPIAQLKRQHGLGDGDGWHWTWLDDKGPLFSPQTETEWILSRLCSKLEHLMDE